jgi:hypothetical protein
MGEVGETVVVVDSSGRRHNVPADRADDFHDGRTGLPISDAEYDESKRRLEADNMHLVPEEHRPKEES